jgi:catechol 2,3-dioxygenase-like lactoylglutathione lyase family enzyme
MEANEVKRGRLIDHLQLVVRDVAKSRRFYEAVLAPLGLQVQLSGEDFFVIDELFVSSAKSPAARGELTGRTHFAFQARTEEQVRAFHKAGIEAGGRDNGPPGARPYHPGYYAAFLIDPDGNNVEAVYHGPGKYSADAITITF